ncbi:MAG: hypothetical protein Q4C74_06380 [Rothia sp. (in: high G+C Gram-positive bacteria)]|nr:hypothetical protein [Rothia sp. (in: high G+C Gram-positive bacteria)]
MKKYDLTIGILSIIGIIAAVFFIGLEVMPGKILLAMSAAFASSAILHLFSPREK